MEGLDTNCRPSRVEPNRLRSNHELRRNSGDEQYLTTEEAATYLRRSVSWLLKQPDIPYVRGVPNIYRKQDLDDWFERHMFRPAA